MRFTFDRKCVPESLEELVAKHSSAIFSISFMTISSLVTFKSSVRFPAWFSTETALLFATNSWFSSLEHGTSVCSVFLDLKKAFDSVPHRPLLNTLATLISPLILMLSPLILSFFPIWLQRKLRYPADLSGTLQV